MSPAKQEINAAFFERDPRASEIRKTCIQFIQAWTQLSSETKLDRAVPASELEEARGRLETLEIVPNMHKGRDYRFFQTHPVEAAEYCAGQLVQRPASEADNACLERAYFALDDVGTHAVSQTTEASILSAERSGHADLIQKAIPRDIIRIVANLLDANIEV